MGDFDPIKRNMFNSLNQINQGFNDNLNDSFNDNVINQKVEEIKNALIKDPVLPQSLRNDIFMLLDMVSQFKNNKLEKQALIDFSNDFINTYKDNINEMIDATPNKSVTLQQEDCNITFRYFEKKLMILIE